MGRGLCCSVNHLVSHVQYNVFVYVLYVCYLYSNLCNCLCVKYTCCPPPINSLKLNVDCSSVKLNADASISGICRDHQGKWVSGFSKKCKVQNALVGELLALLTGLQIIQAKGWQNVLVSSDCKQALKRIQDPSIIDINCINVDICRGLTMSRSDIILEFSPRSTNKVADRLANKMCKTE